MIHIIGSTRFKVNKKHLLTIMTEYLAKKKVSPDLLINVVFVGRRKMLYIATTYKKEPEALPVLCFPYITQKRMIFKTHGVSDDSAGVETPQQDDIPDTIRSLSPDGAITDPEPPLLGEIFICYPQAVLLAAERNKRVDDMMLFLIHHAIDNLLLGKEGTHYSATR